MLKISSIQRSWPARVTRQLVPWRPLVWGWVAGVLLAGHAWAADYRFGINAEVSYKESEAEVRQRYTPLLQELGKLTGHRLTFYPVYSDRVEQALAGQDYDFLLIHTHAALRAEKQHRYQVVGFTQDRKNDQVYFLVQPDHPAKTLADIASASIGVPGLQSWATATARSTLRREAGVTEPAFVTTRYQEAVPFMVELHSVNVGVTRSKKLADDYVAKKKLRVLYVTAAMPLNAVVAAPAIPASVVAAVQEAMATLSKSRVFDTLAFKSLSYSAEQSKALHDFYQPVAD